MQPSNAPNNFQRQGSGNRPSSSAGMNGQKANSRPGSRAGAKNMQSLSPLNAPTPGFNNMGANQKMQNMPSKQYMNQSEGIQTYQQHQ